MWLINTETLEMKDYQRPQPKYVILSHRWTNDETTFKDFKKKRNTESPGYKKVVEFCKLARSRGYQYAWADTCCVDKRSSAELSEAINSMYKWYEESEECYVHLSDVELTADDLQDQELVASLLRQSSWFTRGWTLQELIAPSRVAFFTNNWQLLGWKSSEDLICVIEAITGIKHHVLTKQLDLTDCSIYARMSWLSKRQVTREEDIAYCALGIFSINMPLLYGEGPKAWYRLQEEILRTTDDESIFAWRAPSPDIPHGEFQPLLSPAPSCFIGSTSWEHLDVRLFKRLNYTMTNRGLELELSSGSALRVDISNKRFIWLPLNVASWVGNELRAGFLLLAKLTCGHYEKYIDSARVSCEYISIVEHVRNSPLALTSDETVLIHMSPGRCTRKFGSKFRPTGDEGKIAISRFVGSMNTTSSD